MIDLILLSNLCLCSLDVKASCQKEIRNSINRGIKPIRRAIALLFLVVVVFVVFYWVMNLEAILGSQYHQR